MSFFTGAGENRHSLSSMADKGRVDQLICRPLVPSLAQGVLCIGGMKPTLCLLLTAISYLILNLAHGQALDFSKGWGSDKLVQDRAALDQLLRSLDAGGNKSNAPGWQWLKQEVPPSFILPKSLDQLLEFNHDSIMMGGNITGGGEVVMVFGGQLASNGSEDPRAQKCRGKGYVLSDLMMGGEPVQESFEFRKTHPYLKKDFSDDELLFGSRIDLSQAAPRTWALLHQKLAEWETNSPIFAQLIRSKLATLEWKTTNLPLLNPLSENGSVPGLVQQVIAQIMKCEEQGELEFDLPNLVVHETIGSYWPGRGVMLSNTAWSATGDRSRVGTIVHEALRSFQYEDLFPISHGQVRRVVAKFVSEKASDHPAHTLDNLLLTHAVPSLGSAWLVDESRLKLACGDSGDHKDWVDFEEDHFSKFDQILDSLVGTFLPEKDLALVATPTDRKLRDMPLWLKFRTALVFGELVRRFGPESMRQLIQSGLTPAWLRYVEPGSLSRENFLSLKDEYWKLKTKVCKNPEFTEKWGPIMMPDSESQKYMKIQDLLFTIIKTNVGATKHSGQSASWVHPNLYLPAKDHTAEGFRYRLQQYLADPSALSQFKLLIERVGGVERFLRLNHRYQRERAKVKSPPDSFLRKAYSFSDI